MSSQALESQGMELKIGDGASPEVFAAISEIKTFTGPGGSATVIDVTDLSSAAKEKRMGLADEGQLSLPLTTFPQIPNTPHFALLAPPVRKQTFNWCLLMILPAPHGISQALLLASQFRARLMA